jgi:hypothetical protein
MYRRIRQCGGRRLGTTYLAALGWHVGMIFQRATSHSHPLLTGGPLVRIQ